MKKIWGVILISIVCAFAVFAAVTDAHVSLKGSKTYLRKEQDLFDQMWGGQVRTVPDDFRNKKIHRLGMKPRKGADDGYYDPVHVPVTFKVSKPGNVYIIVDIRVSRSFVKDGWAVVDEGKWGWLIETGGWDEKRNRVRGYHILTQHYEAGEYTLPASEGIGTRVIDK